MFVRADVRRRSRCLAAAVLVFASAAASLLAASEPHAQERPISFVGGRASEVSVARGQFRIMRTAVDIGRMVVGDPRIATAVPTEGRSFYILGNAEGRTNVAVHGPDGALIGMLDVEVGADTPDLEDSIREAVPRANVRIQSVNGRLRLSGSVPDAIALRRVLETAAQYAPDDRVINALRVTGGQQVMLEVRFIEVSRTAGRELGVSFSVRRENDSRGRGFTTGAFRPGYTGSGPVPFNANLPSGSVPFGTLLGQILGGGIQADILVQALEEKGLARRLAEPNLVALSGDKASFLAGGEVPIPVSEEDGQVTVTFKEYGVRLNFTPTVLDNGLINLKLEPEVSQVDPTTSVRFGLVEIPGFVTRRTSTTVELRDGQGLAIMHLANTAAIGYKLRKEFGHVGSQSAPVSQRGSRLRVPRGRDLAERPRVSSLRLHGPDQQGQGEP